MIKRIVEFIFNTFKQTLGVLLIESEQLSGSFANLGQGELDPPHLTLVPQSILALKEDSKQSSSVLSSPNKKGYIQLHLKADRLSDVQ